MGWALFGLKISSENYENLWRDDYEKRPVLSSTIHPDIKKTLVSMSERTGMSVSQVTDEVLYTGLVEMQELPELEERGGMRLSIQPPVGAHWPLPSIHKVVSLIFA